MTDGKSNVWGTESLFFFLSRFSSSACGAVSGVSVKRKMNEMELQKKKVVGNNRISNPAFVIGCDIDDGVHRRTKFVIVWNNLKIKC
jgi:hypothetical protein